MARTRTSRLKYQWKNGTFHSRPEKTKPMGLNNASPSSNPFAPGGIADQQNLAYLNSLPSTKAAQAAATPVQPLDPDTVNAQVTARRNVGLGDLYATWQQGNLDQNYGFGAGGAANPYSKAKLLEENFKRSQVGTATSYAANRQFDSGAYGRQQNENQRNYDIGYDQLRREYDQQTGENQFGRLQNYADAGSSVDDTTFNNLLKALGRL